MISCILAEKYAVIPPAETIKYIKYKTAITIAPIYPNVEICFASLESFTFNGESGSFSCISSAILPIIVFKPVFRTSSTPSPSNTTAPRKSECASTKVSPVISSGRLKLLSALVFLHSSASPFKAELSTLKEPSRRMPSAGILSPDCKSTLSPTTTSSTQITVTAPFRYTLHLSFSVLSLSSLYFVSLATPVLADTTATISTAIIVPNGSYISA